MKFCKFCNAELRKSCPSKELKFCSKSCSSKYRCQVLKIFNRKREGTVKNCLNCQKEIYVFRCLEGIKSYCSGSCRSSHKKAWEKLIKKVDVKCHECGVIFQKCPSTVKLNKNNIIFCSRGCKNSSMKKGETPWGFKSQGIEKLSNPYTRKQKNGVRKSIHRRLMEEFIGRTLNRKEHVHHINKDKSDNRIENLIVLSSSEHARFHKSE